MSRTQPDRLTIILDVDNVIYDNEVSNKYADKALVANYGEGADRDFDKVYHQVRDEFGHVDWKEVALRFTQRRKSDDYASVLAIFLEIPFKENWRPGALELLDFLKQNTRLIILSDGDNLYQKTKIEKLGLNQWSDEVIIVKSKITLFKQLDEKYGADLILIDDKPDVIFEAKRILKGRTVWVKYGHHADKAERTDADFETADLSEVQRYLESVA